MITAWQIYKSLNKTDRKIYEMADWLFLSVWVRGYYKI